jgi:hypothetical protein
MLSSPVYTKSHPRRDAGRGHSLKSFQPFNSFPSNSFRTLLQDRRPQSFCFQMLADSFHHHGGVYPPRTERLPRMGLSQTGDSTQLRALVVFHTFHESRGTNHEAAVALPLRSDRNAFISFFFLRLQASSFATRGAHPLPPKECAPAGLANHLPIHRLSPGMWIHRSLRVSVPLWHPSSSPAATRLRPLFCRTLQCILPSQ